MNSFLVILVKRFMLFHLLSMLLIAKSSGTLVKRETMSNEAKIGFRHNQH